MLWSRFDEKKWSLGSELGRDGRVKKTLTLSMPGWLQRKMAGADE